MSDNIPEKLITDLIAEVIQIQREYAHEWVGVKTERRNRIREVINRLATEKLEQ